MDVFRPAEFRGGRFAADAECHRTGEPAAYTSAQEIVRDGCVSAGVTCLGVLR